MASVWSGSLNFGLVAIPVKLQTAVRENDLHFNFLHATDNGRVKQTRKCSVCEIELAAEDLVKGYEISKGCYVHMEEDDFKRAAAEATQAIDIVQFVDPAEIDPKFFDKPYFVEPEKKGRRAYALLREALRDSGKVGISRIVMRSREHIAAVTVVGDAMVLNLMHFADELIDAKKFDFPVNDAPAASEMSIAKMLIDSMVGTFEPAKLEDGYRASLMAVIEARAAGVALPEVAATAPVRDNVIDLVAILQKSLDAKKASAA